MCTLYYIYSMAAYGSFINPNFSFLIFFFIFSSLICYKLPSKQNLQDFLDKNKSNLTAQVAYDIAKDLIKAINYLSSKQIVHNTITTRNILVTGSLQVRPLVCVLSIKKDLGVTNVRTSCYPN